MSVAMVLEPRRQLKKRKMLDQLPKLKGYELLQVDLKGRSELPKSKADLTSSFAHHSA